MDFDFLKRSKLAFAAASSLSFVGSTVGIGCALNAPERFSLRELIKGETNRGLLGEGVDFWDIKYDTYTRFVKPKNPLKLVSENGEGLKQWCQTTLNEEIEVEKKDSSNYPIVLKLCTKPTHSEKLLKNKRTLVGKGFWEVKVLSYKAAKGKYVIPTIKDYNQATKEQIENWCNENVEQETENEDSTYELTVKWCSYEE